MGALVAVSCPLCGGSESEAVLVDRGRSPEIVPDAMACTSMDHGHFGRIGRCVGCGLMFRNPREDDETILSFYQKVEDELYLEHEEGRRDTFRRALDKLESVVGVRGSLLDVGCYTGAFLDVAHERGWEVAGVEPSHWAAEIAAQRGHLLYCRTLADAPFGDRIFDLVTMWDVIEHYPHPLDELRMARRLVRPGGYLALSTMNVASAVARLLRGRWPWYMRMHLFYFTPQTIRSLLRAAGWEVVKIEPYVHMVTLGYLARKLETYCRPAGRALGGLAARFRFDHRVVPIDLRDFMTVYAKRK
ncbi:MAG: class I SAM-dependent methyltransferase [Candidatus Rokubacteria bacterium]|nr:class I SAM-dependent methyltransferase [Candidatus Rokubacteria bacterium]